METQQRYYWIKLTDKFLTSDTVDFLMSQKDGANYVVLYQMLCLKSINNNGELSRQIGELIIPFDEEKIQRDTKHFSIDTIRVAMELYKKLGLIYVQDNGILKISNFERLVGSECSSAERVREYRERKRLLQCNTDVTQDKDIRDKILDIRGKDIDIEKKTSIDVKENEQLFDMFWESYPRKDCKQNAKKKFLSIKNLNKKFDLIMFALNEEKQKEQWKTPQYIPMAQTWLNQERWVDYEDAINQPKNKPLNEIKQEQQTSSFDEKDFFQANLDAQKKQKARDRKYWIEQLGEEMAREKMPLLFSE